ncbi:hypothetical protein FA09DRAFT_361614 [Tilletiopsis washingtonensis]|uniref:Karyogamy protein 5 n=1 Tax=Tilletiopsis washingtonensis TaxID=58919 RepID=A0A316Z5Q5_9BASI|nr:hypothetical protein FA09DRAFT_361614 [Tilletiopsis washingtonensis]PWN96891.1 hypothetical protein FA09DRAFT_361614 [Tilletiopsis washingtonensis]
MRGRRVAVCVAAVVVLCVPACAWPGYGSRVETTARSLISTRDAEVADEAPVAPEILSASHPLLFTASHAALQSYLSKPDCFRLAVPLTDCDTLERDPEARVRAAIELTRCELATARLNAPLECLDLSPKRAAEACVEALSRSPQAWSSYSGHLREVSVLCHAFRHSEALDEARKIYASLAREKRALLSMLVKHEKAAHERSDQDASRRTDEHESRQATEAAAREILRDLSTELIAGVGGWQRAVQAQEQRLREMLADLSVQTSSDISTKLHEVIDDLVATLAKASDAAHAHFELGLERTLQQHSASLSVHLDEPTQQLAQHVAHLHDAAIALHASLTEATGVSRELHDASIRSLEVVRDTGVESAALLSQLHSGLSVVDTALEQHNSALGSATSRHAEQVAELQAVMDDLTRKLKEQNESSHRRMSITGWWTPLALQLLGISTPGREPSGEAWDEQAVRLFGRAAELAHLRPLLPAAAVPALSLFLRGTGLAVLMTARAATHFFRLALMLVVCLFGLSCRRLRPLWARLLARASIFDLRTEHEDVEVAALRHTPPARWREKAPSPGARTPSPKLPALAAAFTQPRVDATPDRKPLREHSHQRVLGPRAWPPSPRSAPHDGPASPYFSRR